MKKYLFAFIGLLSINPAFAQDKLIIAASNRGNFDTTMTEFALKKGYYNKCNATIEHFWTSSGAESMSVVISGSGDIALAAPFSAALGAYQKGAPVRMIGTTFTGNDSYWYVKKDSPIKTVEDLKGKKVAFTTVGSTGDISTRILKKGSGVDFQPVAAGINMIGIHTGVMTDQFDSGLAAIPTLIDKVLTGEIRVIATSEKYVPSHNGISNRMIVANKESAEKKKQLIECWMRGVTAAFDYFFNEESAAEEYAKMVELPVEAIRHSRTLIKRNQFDLYEINGFNVHVGEALEIKAITYPLTEEQIKDIQVKMVR